MFRSNSRFHLMDFSKLDKYVNTESTYSMVRSVLDMIDTGFADPYHAMSLGNVTLEEEIHAEVALKFSMDKCTALMRGNDNCRFLYFDTYKGIEDSEFGFNKLLFSKKSNVDNGAVNNHCTYFISRDVKENKDNTLALVVSIIVNKMNRYLETEYGLDIDRYMDTEGVILPPEYIKRSPILLSYIKFRIQYRTTLYSTLDACMGLKYADWENVDKVCSKLLYDDIISDYYQNIYCNAITKPRTDEDDNKLFKDIYSHILYK